MTQPSSRNLLPIIATLLLLGVVMALNPWTLSVLRGHGGTPPSPAIEKTVWGIDGVCVALAALFFCFRSSPRSRAWSERLLIISIAAGTTLGIFDLMFPITVRFLPNMLHDFVPFKILPQTSKQGLLPHNYIAIVGDSNAAGAGDWNMSCLWTRQPFHSAHLLHEKLHRDVVTFGEGGAGSIRGLVRQPVQAMLRLRHRYHLEDPAIILAYFTEGNDLEDNLRELSLGHFFPDDRPGPIDSHAFFKFLDDDIVGSRSFGFLTGRLQGIKFLKNWAIITFGNYFNRSKSATTTPNYIPILGEPYFFGGNPFMAAGQQYNRAEIGGQSRFLEDPMQGPCLELTHDEKELGLRVFDLSLQYLRREFPHSKVEVVYIPSPLTCYQFKGPIATITYFKGRKAIYPAETLYAVSREIASGIERLSRNDGAQFIDMTPALQQACHDQLLHGPNDMGHFNKAGYEVLSQALAPRLSASSLPSSED